MFVAKLLSFVLVATLAVAIEVTDTNEESESAVEKSEFWREKKNVDRNPVSEYDASSAEEKSEYLWKKINEDKMPGTWFSGLSMAAGLLWESMAVSFDTVSDLMPPGRKKLIHSVSVIAKAKWEAVPGNPYSGLFQGADFGYLRLTFSQKPDENRIAPSTALKFLRDGKPSGNIFAMYDLAGQDVKDLNYFGHNISNHPISSDQSLKRKALTAKFATASKWPTMLGLSSFADYDQRGAQAQPVAFPYETVFEPAASLAARFKTGDMAVSSFAITVTAAAPAGTAVYRVHCRPAPGAPLVPCATVVTASDFTTSAYSDHQLFFQHTRMEDDAASHPEWAAGMEADAAAATAPLH